MVNRIELIVSQKSEWYTVKAVDRLNLGLAVTESACLSMDKTVAVCSLVLSSEAGTSVERDYSADASALRSRETIRTYYVVVG